MQRPTLEGAAEIWQTPGTDSFRSRGGDRKDEMGLDQQSRNWGPPRAETVDGLWTTPCADDTGMREGRTAQGGKLLSTQAGIHSSDQWATPNVPNGGRSIAHAEIEGRTATHNGKKVQVELGNQVKDWPTPRTVTGGPESAERKKELGRLESGGGDLQSSVLAWPTPATRDYKGENSEEHVTTNGTGRMHMDQLPNFVAHGSHCARPDQPTDAGQTSSKERRTLNPLFVEWLMGWPTGWTDCERPVTEFSHWLLRGRGVLLALCSPAEEPVQGSLL